MDVHKVNAAIQAGLERCRCSDPAITEMAVFVEGLKSAGWSFDETRAVELGMTRVLANVADAGSDRRLAFDDQAVDNPATSLVV